VYVLLYHKVFSSSIIYYLKTKLNYTWTYIVQVKRKHVNNNLVISLDRNAVNQSYSGYDVFECDVISKRCKSTSYHILPFGRSCLLEYSYRQVPAHWNCRKLELSPCTCPEKIG